MTTATSTESLLDQMDDCHSLFENAIRKRFIPVCDIFGTEKSPGFVTFVPSEDGFSAQPDEALLTAFPVLSQHHAFYMLKAVKSNDKPAGKKIAVLFSGGPAPGGHNVVAGIKRMLGDSNFLFGVKNGPKGLMAGDLVPLTEENIARVINTGGFDLLGSDRTKISTPDQYEKVKDTVARFDLSGIIVIGGDDSNTNAAFLAEYLAPQGCHVVSVPKTIDGDLQVGRFLPISFGFDTATKIYAEMVGNILQDAPSSRKYWHFIKLMGRSASHVTLEVALQTRPPIALISEEISEKKLSLREIVDTIASLVAYRAAKGRSYGVVLIPEGLIESIPEFTVLIKELNSLLANEAEVLAAKSLAEKVLYLLEKLSPQSAALLRVLPESVRHQLLLDRDSHGNLQLSHVQTESLLVDMVNVRLLELKRNPAELKGNGEWTLTDGEVSRFLEFQFSTTTHFFGYEGRCGAPTCFDAAFAYNLGLTAAAMILSGRTGYMAAVTGFSEGAVPLAIPLLPLLTREFRKGKESLVIKKTLADIGSPAFRYFRRRRDEWARRDCFTSPGPRQFDGKPAHQIPFTVVLNQSYNSLYFSY